VTQAYWLQEQCLATFLNMGDAAFYCFAANKDDRNNRTFKFILFFWINTDYQTRNTMTFMVIQFHFSSTQSKRKITVVSAGKHIAVISIKIIASRCFLIQKNKNFAIFYLMSLIWLGCFRTVTCANIIITICSGFPNSEEQVLLCSQYLRHIMALEHDCIISL